jgi:hypothetical protein
LGLSVEQAHWLDVLDESDRAELKAALSGEHPPNLQTVDAIKKVLMPRSHVLSFVGYGNVPDRRSVCDGLFRE